MKNAISKALIIATVVLVGISCGTNKSTAHQKVETGEFNFIIANDLGRNGFYEQRPLAAVMGEWAGKADIEFVVANGDVHHFNGVASLNDPLWMTNYELIYDHPDLMLDWYPLLGNHEYRGNTQACLDYGSISRRWVMPGRYYTKVVQVDDSTTLRLLFIDTVPLIDKYRNDSTTYPDAQKQDMAAQLNFIDSVLSVSDETWTMVIGHHPIYAFTPKSESERTDMQKRVDTILRKHKVDYYVSGHLHTFQHIRKPDSDIDYIVNSSASLARPVEATEGTQFCSNLEGFLIVGLDAHRFTINMVDKTGESIYTHTRTK